LVADLVFAQGETVDALLTLCNGGVNLLLLQLKEALQRRGIEGACLVAISE